MRTNIARAIRPLLGLVLCAVACASCGSVVREGRGASYLIVDSLTAASGAAPDTFGAVLQSDVVTLVEPPAGGTAVPTIYEDLGRVSLRLAMKDVTNPTGPTTNNEITISRYHVKFVRTDGRNGQGVDVPYEFDGAVTATIQAGTPSSVAFIIVRAQAKKEAPLSALVGGGGALVISTIAEVTFYGRDQAGNEVTASATMSVHFADWGDPK